MKPRGLKKQPLTEKQLEAAKLYLESDLSLKEVGEMYGTGPSHVQYWKNRYIEECEKNAKKD